MQTNLICTHTLILNSLLFFSWKKHKRGLLITQVFWSFALVRSSSWEVVEKNVFDFPATSCLISFFPHAVWFSHPRCSPRKEKGEMNYCLAQTNRKIEWARVCMCLKHWNAAFCSPSRGSDETVSCTFPLTDADMLRLHASLCLNSTFLLVQFSFFFLCHGNGLIILWLGWGTKPNWFGKKHHVLAKKKKSTSVVSKPSWKLSWCLLVIVETLECCSLHLAAVSPICCATAMNTIWFVLCWCDKNETQWIEWWLEVVCKTCENWAENIHGQIRSV